MEFITTSSLSLALRYLITQDLSLVLSEILEVTALGPLEYTKVRLFYLISVIHNFSFQLLDYMVNRLFIALDLQLV